MSDKTIPIGAGIIPLIALLSACVATPPAPSSLSPTLTLEQFAIPQQFTVTGRFAVRHGNEGASGRFQWSVQPEKEQWLFTTPIGKPLAQITVTTTGAALVTADGQHQLAPHPEVLLASVLPGELPSWSLWRQMLWKDTSFAKERGIAAQESSAVADGWQWRLHSPNGRWPQRLEATRGETTIILVIEERILP